MHRIAKTTLVALVALGAGACASAGVRVATSPVVIQVPAPAEPIPEIEIQALAIRTFPDLLATVEEVEPEPTCDLAAEILADDPELAAVQLAVGTKEFRYTEHRGGKTLTFTDPQKDIALRIVDSATCEKTIVVITKRGDQLIAPPGWDIEAVAQNNGIRWNNWATLYRVNAPSGKVAIRSSYPYVRGAGKKRTITNVIYSVPDVLLPELARAVPKVVASAKESQTNLAKAAITELRARGVKSRALPDLLLADTPIAVPELSAQLLVVEHTDLGNFAWDPMVTVNFTLAKVGANKGRFATLICNSSGACGPYQITDNSQRIRNAKGKLVTLPGTYTSLRQSYPEARLMPNFQKGAKDPLNAMMLTFLHHDNVLKVLIEEFGTRIMDDQQTLLELVGAGYNSGAGRVVDAYRARLEKGSGDWITALTPCRKKKQPNCIPAETIGYVEKFRFVQSVWDNPDVALTN